MTKKLDRIIQGDCVEKLDGVDAGSVDLVFADPPFNIGYDYDEYDDKRPCEDYLDWSKRWISGIIRVLKPNGTFWLAIGDEYAAELKVMTTRELGLTCRNWVVWYYTFGVHCTRKFTRSHAHLLYFVKHPKKFTFNADAIRVPSARQLVYADKRANPKGRLPDDTWIMSPTVKDEGGRMKDEPDVLPSSSFIPHPSSFILRPQDLPDGFNADSDTWYFPRVCGTFKEREGFHGCQMPEQLLGRIIKACSNEGDLVLDPFTGSGTTLAVAKKLRRRWLGIELSERYVSETQERLIRARPGDALDGTEDPLTSAPDTLNGKVRFAGSGLDRTRHVKTASTQTSSRNPDGTSTAIGVDRVAVCTRGEFDDLDQGVIQAFRSVHRGFSTDWLLANKELNGEFSEACRRLGLPGSTAEWNRRLIRLRKASKLGAIGARRPSSLNKEMIRECEFASEIALSQFCGVSLDTVLCEPELASHFDELAGAIAPGFGSIYYRWAALQLRKQVDNRRKSAERIATELPGLQLRHAGAVEDALRNHVPSRQGVYLLRVPTPLGSPGAVLYVGETGDLHRWLSERLETEAFRQRPFSHSGGKEITFDFVRRMPQRSELRAIQAHMVDKYHSPWNHRPRLDAA